MGNGVEVCSSCTPLLNVQMELLEARGNFD